jgi:hypothetical protein
MAVEKWIDKIALLAGRVQAPDGKRVRSFYVYKDKKFPDAVIDFPSAYTFTTEMQESKYSLSGPIHDIYVGKTEFHVYSDDSNSHYSDVQLYFGRIRAIFAGSMTLGGTVKQFLLFANSATIQPIKGSLGTEAPHWIVVANWKVIDKTAGEFTPAM